MAGVNKRYYWLKLKDDFFTSRKMKKLRKVAGGDTYTIIYLKLQLLSINSDGIIEFEGTDKDIFDQLSLDIDEDVDDIKMTIAFLSNNDLCQMNGGSDLFLTEVPESIGSETASTIRSRKSRENRKKIESNNKKKIVSEKKALQCNTDATNCNTDIDIDKDEDIDKELEKEKRDNNIDLIDQKSKAKSIDSKAVIYYYYHFVKNNNNLSDYDLIDYAIDNYGVNKVLYILYYLKTEQKANISSFNYVLTTLKDFKDEDRFMVDYIANRELKRLKNDYIVALNKGKSVAYG